MPIRYVICIFINKQVDIYSLAKLQKDIFKSRKDELINKAKVSVQGYLDSLENELKDKKAQLVNYTRAIASINEIEKIL